MTWGLVHPVGPVHSPALQVWPVVQMAHAPPAVPHALTELAWHCPAEQHPSGHDVALHTHTLFTQVSPAAQAPAPHCPPHPSPAPQSAPVQSGTHALQPPLLHDRPAAHTSPAQHTCPLPPQETQLPATQVVVPAVHATHCAPAVPQAPGSVPLAHATPLQHPAHVAGSHWHAPPTQV